MDRKQAEELYKRYREGRVTPEEAALIEDAYLRLSQKKELPPFDEAYIKKSMWNVIQRRRLRGRRRLWLRITAAASVILSFIWGLYFYGGNGSEGTWHTIPATEVGSGENKATLTLADGTVVDLSTEQTGIVIEGSQVTYENGGTLHIAKAEGTRNSDNPYMLLSTPKGGQYQITLSDGTKVWLNANSSLRYPEQFKSDKREVVLQGEAFFKVKSQAVADKLVPFQVRSAEQVVEVLGTEFNISAYPDDAIVRTSLVAGSVRVSSHRNQPAVSKLLRPGQQSLLSDEGFTISDVDVEEVTAWTQGYFKFSGTLEDILRQVSRWYEVDIQFRESSLKQQRIYGYVNRNTPLSEVLHILEAGSDARFVVEAVSGNIQERRVVVMK
jgi:transmembrane sensor